MKEPLTHIEIKKSLHRSLKLLAFERGVNLKDLVELLILRGLKYEQSQESSRIQESSTRER